MRIDKGPLDARAYASQIPKEEWRTLISQRSLFCAIHIPSDCRDLLRFVEEADQLRMWEHFGYPDLAAFIRSRLHLDPIMVQWAIDGLRTMEPDKPIPFETAVEVGKLRAHGVNQYTLEDDGPSHAKVRYGANRAYTLARLRRDDPDMAEQVERGELSANAAAVEKGWRKPPDPFKQLCRWWQKATPEQRIAFEEWKT